ncbi:UDP-N-acetylglucosamine 2-epimerase [Methanococcus aeolicus Nankai-3]|uniref:UDP-N-acetylglucosamine 2-epimerase n=1 Tax=Methanococcus aeolicus (strain ATCC BAA-1280 / DSM 17508 / OCM 812 / Nankai-3) TaxID=419665 RepID=A6UU99_META3|nr:UDP-N-acetylglucosamine 2-epimerase (non-hydrolyzing) [Methanococcus aeolicus]ABR56071.1 UDP-N-acetylglucosamine 2-epimerase [Methanococcus aeolicus Nankai-3]
MKIAIILGTRPEIIKLSSIIRELQNFSKENFYSCKTCEANLKHNQSNTHKDNKNIEYFIIHTNQHYSKNMDEIFFKELNLPTPKYNLNVGSGTHGEQTAKMIDGIEKILISENPDVVIVQGDTNTVLAGALSASKLHIKVAHVEAGLRSYDRNMPEETNRVLTDHISNYLFAPTEIAKHNLLKEGINKNVFVVGNTIVDATIQNIEIAENIYKYNNMSIKTNINEDYFLLTLHRAENTDNKERLTNIVNAIIKATEQYNKKIIFPMHPRTEKKLKEYNLFENLQKNSKIEIIEPVGYLEFLLLEKNAKLILTDSGGVQEEACILGAPCITLRDNTERPETIYIGSNILVNADINKILDGIGVMANKKINGNNPFGDGNSGKAIVKILLEN